MLYVQKRGYEKGAAALILIDASSAPLHSHARTHAHVSKQRELLAVQYVHGSVHVTVAPKRRMCVWGRDPAAAAAAAAAQEPDM